MKWQRRLREILLAGGTLAVAGCSSQGRVTPEEAGASGSSSSGSGPGVSSGGACCNASADPCCYVFYCGETTIPECSCRQDGGSWLVPLDECIPSSSNPPCCGGNSDPCCPYTTFGYPGVCQDVMYPACACELDGGTWTDAGQTCTLPADAGGSDASADATTPSDASLDANARD